MQLFRAHIKAIQGAELKHDETQGKIFLPLLAGGFFSFTEYYRRSSHIQKQLSYIQYDQRFQI